MGFVKSTPGVNRVLACDHARIFQFFKEMETRMGQFGTVVEMVAVKVGFVELILQNPY